MSENERKELSEKLHFGLQSDGGKQGIDLGIGQHPPEPQASQHHGWRASAASPF